MTNEQPFIDTILHTHYTELLAGQPLSDGPRLVYADWLEERGDPRAELIRVQCELAKMPRGFADALGGRHQSFQRNKLSIRQDELVRLTKFEWKAVVGDVWFDFYRGFPSILSMKLSDWVGEECGACEGCGGTREWNEGLLLYNHHKCGDCRGIGRVNALGPKIVAAVPVERVTITDHCPADRTPSNGNWYWLREIPHGERTQHHLPDFVFFLLKGKIEFDLIGIPFDSAESANAALSLAAIRWAWEQTELYRRTKEVKHASAH